MSRELLDIASWLLECGAGASARNVLSALRGAPANRLRLRAMDASLSPGIYALVALPGGPGVVVPLRPTPGRSRASDPAFRRACDRALDEARAFLRAPLLPSQRFAFEEWLSVFGPSIGLPAALAFVACFASSRALPCAVLATGEILDDGRVGRVGHMVEKQAIAASEREVGRILIPLGEPSGRGADRVATVAEALAIVFGDGPIAPDAGHLHVDAWLGRVHADRDPERAIDLLSALPMEALAPADRARVLLELGTQLRHAGRSGEAARVHGEARLQIAAERDVIGAEAAERYELECWATTLDDFRVDEVVDALRDRLSRPFLKLRNELRCRGLLAQATAMAGRFAEAVAIREANLPLHDKSDALRKIAPATHAHLALDAARAGDSATFERHVLAMRDATRHGDDAQERFNAAAVVRGLVALGRPREALAFARDERRYADVRPPPSIVRLARGSAPIDGHPEVSVARALCRALRRESDPRAAVLLADRVTKHAAGLAGFCAALVDLEASLALDDAGDGDASRARRIAARAALSGAHEGASRHHAALLVSEGRALEAAISVAYY